ncbi:MAG: beta-glucosidase [Candidatus Andeanibacterium colombiense]|uniref:Beta-glucosidase n=1 Tax=Candidatus Andeanibacterium colombiense TaxID=3121345 RepID=A0AAJ6BP40_9SPHN|nr:MAG: beta-glucosidase [Sphingomonadaceae bacterium]
MHKGLLLAAACCALIAGAATAQTAAKDTRGTPDERAAAMLKQMTQEEKLTLVKGYFSTDFPPAKFVAPPEGRAGSAGYVPGIPRLGIPGQWQADAGVGVASQGGASSKRPHTALPSGLALAASWDPQIAYDGGRMIGSEARADGFNVQLAGGVNLVREPRNGRNFEYTGEDPLLAGTIAGHAIAGIQSNHMISTVKHYAFNDQETDRNAGNVTIDEAAGRESDLLAFKIAIEQGNPGSVMCAYNRFRGDFACESDYLLTQVLRKDWGWQGYVMSDWGAAHSAVKAANAGLDQESGFGLHMDDNFGADLVDALAAGSVARARLNEMATRILRSMFEHGLIDDPASPTGGIDFAANKAVSRRGAEAGAVLLKNEGELLPLAGVKRIAVIGGHADKGVMSGGGSSQVYPGDGPLGGNAVPGIAPTSWPGPVVFYPSSPVEELRKQLPGVRIDYLDGSDAAAAAALAGQADVAIVFGTQWASESIDVKLALDGEQDALIAGVAKANPKTVVVLETAGPVRMPWNGAVAAVLEAWLPGSGGGEAIANLLTGRVNPSGRLPVSFPANESQLPYPGEPRKGEIAYTEGAAVGYKWFDKHKLTPLYPFGYGLSYTRFTMDAVNLDQDDHRGLSAEVTLSNIGEREGAQVIQLYASHDGWEAPRRLAGFAKVKLKPGETRKVDIAIDPRLLAKWDTGAHGWTIESGQYAIAAQGDALSDGEAVGFSLDAPLFYPAGWSMPKK